MFKKILYIFIFYSLAIATERQDIVDMLENYLQHLKSEEKKYKNRLRIINELKRLNFPDTRKTKLRTRSRNIKKGGKTKKKNKFK